MESTLSGRPNRDAVYEFVWKRPKFVQEVTHLCHISYVDCMEPEMRQF